MKAAYFFLFIAALICTDIEAYEIGDNLKTLSITEVSNIAAAFSAVCFNEGVDFDSRLALPYFYKFVEECEEYVLRDEGFPHEKATQLFDEEFSSGINHDSFSFSKPAINLLYAAWRDKWRESAHTLFDHVSSWQRDESFDPAYSYSKEVYVLSAILSALSESSYNVPELDLSVFSLERTYVERSRIHSHINRNITVMTIMFPMLLVVNIVAAILTWCGMQFSRTRKRI